MPVVIVPCTAEKIWAGEPAAGATPARKAYTGPYFHDWLTFAENSGHRWFILSTHYGFLEPDELIENYNVGIGSAHGDGALHARMREQAGRLGISGSDAITVIDWGQFKKLIRVALGPTCPPVNIHSMFFND